MYNQIDKNRKTGIAIGLCILVVSSFNVQAGSSNYDELAYKVKNDYVIGSLQVKCDGSIKEEFKDLFSCSRKWGY